MSGNLAGPQQIPPAVLMQMMQQQQGGGQPPPSRRCRRRVVLLLVCRRRECPKGCRRVVPQYAPGGMPPGAGGPPGMRPGGPLQWLKVVPLA